MKSKIIRLTIASIIFVAAWVSTVRNIDRCTRTNTVNCVGDERIEPKATEAMEAMRWYNAQRAYPTGKIPYDWKERAEEHIQKYNLLKPGTLRTLPWTSVGPNNIAGRIRSIAIDPANSNIIYCGSVSGGIWKSTSGGTSWRPISDLAANMVIGCITIDPTNSSTIYAGTGEGYYNVDALRGIGVLKSTDAGESWTVLNNFINSSSFYFINKIVIRPDNPSIIFAALSATDAGVWKSTDAGLSWTKITAPGNSSKFCMDLVIDPSNPNVMYGAFGLFTSDGVYKTTDGGSSWSKLTTGFPLPATKYGRISLAIAPSNSNVIYACLSDSSYNTHSIQKSVNGGSSWSSVGTPYDASISKTHLGGQGWYNNVIKVHPTNPNIVYTGGINLFKSINGGTGWNPISDGYGSPYVHVDQHAIAFDPTNSSVMYFGCDGGMFKSTDSGSSFTDLNVDLRTVQFYSGAVHPTQSIYYGGTQDNGTLKSTSPPSWSQSLGGDGGVTFVNYQTPTTVYTEYVYLSLQKSTTSGNTGSWSKIMNGIPQSGSDPYDGTSDRCLFIAPYMMDPSNPNILVAGTYRIYRTTNGGGLWTAISGDLTGDGPGVVESSGSCISSIAIAKTSSATIYIGTTGSSTSKSQVCVTVNGNNSSAVWDTISKSPLPNRWVKTIAIDPTNRDRVFVGYSGYNSQTLSTPGHIFLTTDRGSSWSDVSGDLPDIPVNAIVIDPSNVEHLAVGTDLGIYESANKGSNWIHQNTGMANVSIADLDLNDNGYLFAATHGRGMFKSDTIFNTSSEPPPPPPIVKKFVLYQNYPNPFHSTPSYPSGRFPGSTTIISFKMGKNALVTIKIYNILGQEVETLIKKEYYDEDQVVELPFDGSDLPSGVYFYRMVTESIENNKILFSETQKMVHVK
jgi:photosystem II stability/assembly factor-like uncharacterized protein